jgi:insecticidal toxin complex protein TccC
MAVAQWIDAHTPSVSVVDSRGLAVRNVAYCRHPLNPSIETRITRNHFDAAGRLVASWDPRLWGTAPKPNLATTHNLQNQPLLVDSVDAGWQLSLLDQVGMARSFWDARGSQRRTEYDQLQRPITVTEQMKDDLPRVAERFAYAQAGDEFAVHNQCGQLIRHDHPAGSRSHCEYGVGGLLLAEETRFLLDLASPDWSSESTGAILEDEVFRTAQQYGASGEMLCQTDARDNFRAFAYNQAGELQEIRLRLAGASGPPQVLVGGIRYDAHGKVERERAANGVVSTARYAAEDGRLAGLLSCDTRSTPLQQFEYAYDPVGNISSVEDKVAVTRYFNQQHIEPINRYRYDSLYQLVEATGREVSQPGHGPALPAWQSTPLDPNQLRNYTQSFNYDAAGNLQTRHHSGVETLEMFTSPDSNRSVAEQGNLVDGFDANGNQRELLRGQQMSWDIGNQLSRVTMVRREDGPDDSECYFYDSPGHRLRKVRLTETARRTLRAEVRYLPGLEIHRDTATGEEWHVLSVEAGLSRVRVLHWVANRPMDVRNDHLRFCLSDHLKSCTLELDELGALVSQEVYYPFGGTALWAGASDIEVKYKTIRYSGKERDATGLCYYGCRYYAPWLQRWISADPAGDIDGLNLYWFVQNDPVKNYDVDGRIYEGIDDEIERSFVSAGYSIIARGLDEFSEVERDLVSAAMNEARSFMISAQEMVNKHPAESEEVLIAYFGERYKSIQDRVVKAWGDIESVISGLNFSGVGADKMVKLGHPDTDTSVAKIRIDDEHGRIFFNQKAFNENEVLSIDVAHEISHLGEVSGISAEGPETYDYWYFPNMKCSDYAAGELLGSSVLDVARENSKIILSGKSGGYLKGVASSLKDRMLERITQMVGGEVVVSNNSDAVDIFNSSQIYRSTMASENADSLVYAAFELYVKYMSLGSR